MTRLPASIDDLAGRVLTSRTSLTARQRQVLSTVVLSASQKCAAAQLGISPCSVRNHLVRIRRRLGATDTAQAVYIATRDGLLDRVLDRATPAVLARSYVRRAGRFPNLSARS